jgi:hypothetical protein
MRNYGRARLALYVPEDEDAQMNFMSGIDGLKHTKVSPLNDLLNETRNALSDFQRAGRSVVILPELSRT